MIKAQQCIDGDIEISRVCPSAKVKADTQFECLNLDPGSSVSDVFKDNDAIVQSDTDEQLMLYVPVSLFVYIHVLTKPNYSFGLLLRSKVFGLA